MIDLSGCKPFASGSNRHCYRHPDDVGRCLKINRTENIEARYQRQLPSKKLLGKQRLNDNLQELKAYRQAAITRLRIRGEDDLVWRHLPRFHGSTNTTLGSANESELILCSDGSVAPTLESRLKKATLSPELAEAIERFLDWLQHTQILTRNLLPHNLVVTDRSGRAELFLVDGLGAPTFPAALATIPGWSSHYISRKIRRFRRRVSWDQDNQGLSWEDFQRKK